MIWDSRPKTHRLAYYSYLARRGLHRRDAEFGDNVELEYKQMRFYLEKGYSEVLYSVYLDEYEPKTCEFMSKQSGEVFVDVGANAGGYTVRLGPRFKKVISVEPNPRALGVLRKNVELNRLSNVVVVEEAVSDAVGETTMNVPSSGKTTRSSIVEKFREGTSFPVHTTTLDSLLGEYANIDLIKIDAEGAEVSVLRGADHTLRRTSRLVLELGAWSEQQITKILEGYGLKISNLDLKVQTGRNVLAERGPDTS